MRHVDQYASTDPPRGKRPGEFIGSISETGDNAFFRNIEAHFPEGLDSGFVYTTPVHDFGDCDRFRPGKSSSPGTR
jgi:hypothetical protein